MGHLQYKNWHSGLISEVLQFTMLGRLDSENTTQRFDKTDMVAQLLSVSFGVA